MSKKGIRFLSMLLSASMALSMPAVPALASEQVPAEFTESVSCVASPGLRAASGIDGEWDDEALFEEYIRSLFYGEPSKNRLRGSSVEKSTLNDTEKWLYGKLKAEIEKIARGERTDTEITVDTSEKSDVFSWTAEECGVTSFSSENITEAVETKLYGIIDYVKVWRCLLSDLPYDLYWHDKTLPRAMVFTWKPGTCTTKKASVSGIIMKLSVSQKYQAGGEYTTNLDQDENLSRVTTAAENAQAIVKEYASETDYNKLYGYMDEICDLNTYNTEAAGDDYHEGYGDPWQLVYVFDKDPDTNVVCEGYSKAFAYLCDQTSFNNRKIKCYIVSGLMDGGTGAGGHMWNVVTMDDGKNYLVDVTNCDGNAVGNPDRLFLAGLPGSVNGRYTFIRGEYEVIYTYYDKMYDLYGTDADSILTLAATDENTLYYRPSGNAVVRVTIGSNSTEYPNIAEALAASDGKDAAIELLADISTSDVAMTGTTTIDLNGHTWNNEGDMSFTSLVLRNSGKNSTGKVTGATIHAGRLEMTSGIVDASVSVTENGDAVISGGEITTLSFGSNATAGICGGSFGTIQTAGQSMQSLLAANYAYYKTNDGGWAAGTELLGTSLSGVEVKAAPLTALRVSGTTEQHTGYDAFSLTADATAAEGVEGTPVYSWAMVDSDGSAKELAGGDSAHEGTLTVAAGKDAGNYTYRVTATKDGYSISQEVTVSIALTPGELSINSSYVLNYTYGQPVAVPKDSDITTNINSADRQLEYIWYHGDYSEKELPSTGGTEEIPSAVGDYTLVAKVTGNGYAPASTKKLVTISRAVLTDEQIKSLVSIPASKTYNRAPAVAESVPDRMPGIGTITVWYQNEQDGNGSFNEVAPVNAGTYNVYVDVTEGTCYEAVVKKKIGSFVISQAMLTADMFAPIPDQAYTGKPIVPGVESPTLAAGDFTVGKCQNNTDVSDADGMAGPHIQVTGQGNYTGTVNLPFHIVYASLAGTVTISGEARCGKTLTAGADITAAGQGALSYQWYRDGTAVAGATEKAFSLTADDFGKKITVSVSAANVSGTIESEPVTVAEGDCPAENAPKNPAVDDVADTFTFHGVDGVAYEYSTDNGATWTAISTESGTGTVYVGDIEIAAGYLQVRAKAVTGFAASGAISNGSAYTGKKNLSGATVSLSEESFTYNGSLQKPDVTVAIGKETVEGACYEAVISSADSGTDSTGSSAGIKAGTVTLTITAKPGTDYTGSTTKDYQICRAKPVVTDVRCINQEELTPAQSPADAVLSCTAKVGEIDVDGVIGLTDTELLAGENQYTWRFTPSDTRNYQEVTGKIKISLLVADEKTVQVDDLSYSFANSRRAFKYPLNYRIPLEIYQNIWGNTVKAQNLYRSKGIWEGSCYGMAATSGIFNTEDSGVNTDMFKNGAEKVCELQIDDQNSEWNINVQKFIETMFVSQYDSLIQGAISGNKGKLSELCRVSKAGNELVLIAVFGKEGGHALLGYRLEDVDGTTAKLYVYDCNFPLQERYIRLTKDGAGDYTEWYYHLNDSYDWGSEYEGCSISFIPYDTYASLWNNSALKRDTTMNLLYINASDASIKDASGREVAKLIDNKLQTDRSDIFQVRDTGITSDNEKGDMPNLIYLPTDTYIIKNLDANEKNFEVSFVNNNFGIEATTTADEVTVHADDESENSSVSVLAKQGETYEMKLENSTGDDYHTVQITGEGKGQAVGANLDHGLINLMNCPEDQMSVEVNGNTGKYYTIETETEGKGSISPSGTYYAVPGSSVTFTMCAAEGYKLEDVLVDGESVGAVDQYELDKVFDDCKILAKFVPEKQDALIENIKLNITSTSVQDKGSMKLEATITPENAANKELKWSSEDPKVATVDSQGIVTAVGVGKTTITVEAMDGSNKKASCVITVTAKPDDGGGSGNGSSSGGSSSDGGGSSSGGSSSGGSSPGGSSSGGGSGNGGSSGGDSGLVVKLSYYIVSFDANGGKNLSRKTMTLLMDDTLGILPKVQRKNYRFMGWYTEKTGGKKVSSSTVLNASTTLYAHWEKIK